MLTRFLYYITFVPVIHTRMHLIQKWACQLNIQSSNDDLNLRKQIISISKMLVQEFGDVIKISLR